MEEGRLVEWKKNEGDPVRIGDVIAEVETDKAVMELVARAEGVLLKQLVPAGATVAVAKLVGIVGQPGEDISALTGGAPAPIPAPKPATTAPLPTSPGLSVRR
jgi:pyruvate dehydrogenase E2 component (dihydrolipoamide acetyltransferase)